MRGAQHRGTRRAVVANLDQPDLALGADRDEMLTRVRHGQVVDPRPVPRLVEVGAEDTEDTEDTEEEVEVGAEDMEVVVRR